MTAIAAKIMSKITADPATGCWNWTGGVHSERKPYGIIHVGSRKDGTREAMRQQEATEAMIMMRQPDCNFNGPHPSPNSDTSHIDQIQDVRDYLRDNGQDGTLNNFDSYLQRLQYWHTYSLNILQRSHAELMVALNGAFGEICNPSLQADKWRDFLANISEVIGRAESLSISSTRIDASTSPPPEKALTALAALRLSESHPSAIREAVEGEREACAKIAEGDLFEVRYRSWPHWNPGGNLSRERDVTKLAEATAAAIRARGEENGK